MHKKEQLERKEDIFEDQENNGNDRVGTLEEFNEQTVAEKEQQNKISEVLVKIDELDDDKNPEETVTNQELLHGLSEKEQKSALQKTRVIGGSVGLGSPEVADEVARMKEIGLFKQKMREKTLETTKRDYIQHVNSDAYLDKLILEFDGNEELAKKEQQNRVDNLNEVSIHFDDKPNDVEIKTADGQSIQSGGYYTTGEHEIHIDKNINNIDLPELLRHELGHASTLGPIRVTENASKKLSSAFESPNDKPFDKEHGRKSSYGLSDEYLSIPTEMLTRKQQLDFKMEQLGIKKYQEPFTDEHYKELWNMYDKGLLDVDEEMFMEFIKKDPEVFKQIFNEIADNPTNDEVENAV